MSASDRTGLLLLIFIMMNGYRRLQILHEIKRILFILILISAMILMLNLNRATDIMIADEPLDQDRNGEVLSNWREQVNVTNEKHYDVLLNSYMRGGSTLTGIILGWRADSFYLYEPLWKISRWAYWHGNDTMCRADKPDCRTVESGKVINDREFLNNEEDVSGSLVMAQKILHKFYDCKLDNFDRDVLGGGIATTFGGPSWGQFRSCANSFFFLINRKKRCLDRYGPQLCQQAKHRVTKVLRLTTDLLGDLLRNKNDLKVIHLFRDPRAIINSILKTSWYRTQSRSTSIEIAKALCSKMLYDFNEGQKLLKLFPDRFRFIYYEDLNNDPFEKIKVLYNFLGMSLDEKMFPRVEELTVFNPGKSASERERNTAYWWRSSLDWDTVREIDSVCANVYRELGYKTFRNLEDYRDMSYKSVDIPSEYLIA